MRVEQVSNQAATWGKLSTVVPLLCDHPSARLKQSRKRGGLLSGGHFIYTKMWDLVPDCGSLITQGTAQQRGHCMYFSSW